MTVPNNSAASIMGLVQAANIGRNHATLPRRFMKATEELGEASEAYLNVTSDVNGKNKSWDDVREELADLLIVALDLNLTAMPDQPNADPAFLIDQLAQRVSSKVDKWNKSSDRSAD